MDKTFPYSIVEKLSFKRCAGTEEEKRAAEIVKEEIENLGGTAEYMNFTIPESLVKKCSLKVVSPYEEEIEVIPYGRSGSLPEGGADLKFFYAERAENEDFLGVKDLTDTIVLINELRPEVYERLCQKNAAAFLTMSGKYYDTLETANGYARNLRPHFLAKGVVPGFMISAKDAMKLVREEVQTIHAELEQEDKDGQSQNVLAVIPGTDTPEESIVLTAHYDSVPVGTGSWDNATGSAALLYIYRHFLKNPAKRTLRFVWCGSEEIGLCGSKAYVEQQEEGAMKEIRFCFNFDMCGTILGMNHIFVTGGEDLKNFVAQFCREKGYSAMVGVGVHSSDSAPFADKGIPSVGLSRDTSTAEIHTRKDLMDTICPKQMVNNSEFAVSMISRVANAAILPVELGMTDDLKKELDNYFRREKKEDK